MESALRVRSMPFILNAYVIENMYWISLVIYIPNIYRMKSNYNIDKLASTCLFGLQYKESADV